MGNNQMPKKFMKIFNELKIGWFRLVRSKRRLNPGTIDVGDVILVKTCGTEGMMQVLSIDFRFDKSFLRYLYFFRCRMLIDGTNSCRSDCYDWEFEHTTWSIEQFLAPDKYYCWEVVKCQANQNESCLNKNLKKVPC